MKPLPFIVLATIALSGCATRTIPITAFKTENRIGSGDVVAIAFDGPRPCVADLHQWGPRQPFDVTAVWDDVFAGAPNAEWHFRLDSSDFTRALAAGGFSTRMTYDISGTLTNGRHSYHITGSGSRAAAMEIFGAMRQAVELGVVNAAQHCKEIIAQDHAITAK